MVTLYKAGVGVGTKDSWCGKRACQQEIIASTGIKSGLPMPRHAAVFSRARVFSAITELVGEIRFRSLRSHDTDTSNVLRSDRCPVIIVIAVVSVSNGQHRGSLTGVLTANLQTRNRLHACDASCPSNTFQEAYMYAYIQTRTCLQTRTKS